MFDMQQKLNLRETMQNFKNSKNAIDKKLN